MASKTMSGTVARAYAQALMELAEADGTLESIGQELAALSEAMNALPAFALFLADPAIGAVERAATLDKLSGQVSPLLERFLKVVNRKGRLSHLREIISAYQDLLDKRLGKVEVDVTVAQRLEIDQLQEVVDRIGKALGRETVAHQYVDEEIIGGLIIRVGDQIIDGSVRSQLSAMRQRLLNTQKR